MAEKKRVIVLGGSFGGLPAAYELKHKLGDKAVIDVISNTDSFTFIPSLIWVVPGRRDPNKVQFKLEPALRNKGIGFIHSAATRIDMANNKVITEKGEESYDYLVVATGPYLKWDAVPGLGPEGGYTHSACSLDHAIQANRAYEEFLKNPGPVVVGAVQGASCFGASYELILNLRYDLKRRGLIDKCPVTFITAEPFLGHFGINGLGNAQQMVEKFFNRLNIRYINNAVVEKIDPDVIHLKGGDDLPFKYSILIPPFRGVQAIQDSEGLANPMGFLPTDAGYRHTKFKNIYAAGISVAVAPPAPTQVPCGVPKTAHMSEQMAAIAAENIAQEILTGTSNLTEEKFIPDLPAMCVLDAGDMGVTMMTDKIMGPDRNPKMFPGPWSHWLKLFLEKYLIWKFRTGRMGWP